MTTRLSANEARVTRSFVADQHLFIKGQSIHVFKFKDIGFQTEMRQLYDTASGELLADIDSQTYQEVADRHLTFDVSLPVEHIVS